MKPQTSAEIEGGPTLREYFSPVATFVAEKLDDTAPNITPNHLSMAGVVLVAAGIYAASKGKTKTAAAFLIAGNAIDAFDGASSDVKNRRNPGSWDNDKGLKIDSACDVTKESSMGFFKILSAVKRRDGLGLALSSLATATTPLSSSLRAHADSQGQKVAETGGNPIEFFGTRTGRTVVNIAGTTSSNRKVQLVSNSLISMGNIVNVIRYKPKDRSRPPVDKHQERARFRTRFHAATFVVTTAGVMGINLRSRQK